MKKVWISTTFFFIVIFAAWYGVIKLGQNKIEPNKPAVQVKISSPIRPSTIFPQYWNMNGQEIMLLGGSAEDNLFQIDSLENHLDLLIASGGNYVRNTMSSRDVGNDWPFAKNEDGVYDLYKWNDDYWSKFAKFLELCHQKEIVVQIELWATFDFYRDNWKVNPFNPTNNTSYTQERVHLPLEVNSHPTHTENNFFRSIPSKESNLKLLEFQQKLVDKLLSYSLQYGNVLYCMDNETSVTAEWGKFWSLYVKKVAKENGKQVYTTEMWDPWNLDHVAHRETFDHPEIYDFVDISQNNHNSGDVHWENGIKQIDRLKSNGFLRPLTNVKIYGNDEGPHQTTQNGIESFARNVLFGAASCRFHRPSTGQGLNATAQNVIRSMRSMVERSSFFGGQPANHLLASRSANEAYCRAIEGEEYMVYFPDAGEVDLIVTQEAGKYVVSWLSIEKSSWKESQETTSAEKKIKLKSPGKANMLALVKPI